MGGGHSRREGGGGLKLARERERKKGRTGEREGRGVQSWRGREREREGRSFIAGERGKGGS